MFELISDILPNWGDWLGEFIGTLGGYFAGGVLAAFIVWAIGFAVYSVFQWLKQWT